MPARINRRSCFMLGTASIILFSLLGCGKGEDGNPKNVDAQVENKETTKPVSAQPASLTKQLDFLPFDKAVVLDSPLGEFGPPDTTCNNKNTGKIYETIKNELWNQIVFSKDGKRVKYHAVITTELGEIHLDLFDEAAPNHVRSFVCLAKTGYFDGMTFYKSLNYAFDENVVAYVETGCPRGTGERYSGSIGYWLKPEINNKLTHEEGTVGAYHDPENEDTAACRFYIAAAAMPHMDTDYTIFGKVTRGLDIVRIMNKREVNQQDDRLKEPVLIRSVVINTTLH